MQELDDVQQAIATAPEPAEEFGQLSRERKREVFFGAPESLQQSLVADMDTAQLQAFVRRLDPDELTDVLALATAERREEVLNQLDQNRREKVEYLLGFEAESAGGLMRLILVAVNS